MATSKQKDIHMSLQCSPASVGLTEPRLDYIN